MTCQKWLCLYHAERHRERKKWRGSTFNTSCLTMASPTKLSLTEIPVSPPNGSLIYVHSLKSPKTLAPPIIPKQMDNQSEQTKRSKSSYVSTVTTVKMIGSSTSHSHNLRSTRDPR